MQYENGGLQRRVWAEKMESRQMRHFFPEEFMDVRLSIDVHQIEHYSVGLVIPDSKRSRESPTQDNL